MKALFIESARIHTGNASDKATENSPTIDKPKLEDKINLSNVKIKVNAIE